jgi:hypothetical protein
MRNGFGGGVPRNAANPGLSRKRRSVCAPQSGDCHQFPPLELDGCTRFALRETLRLAASPKTVKHPEEEHA